MVLLPTGNNVVDYHGSDFFNEDCGLILSFVYERKLRYFSRRLEERQYQEVKIRNNLESEIFQVGSIFLLGCYIKINTYTCTIFTELVYSMKFYEFYLSYELQLFQSGYFKNNIFVTYKTFTLIFMKGK